MWSASRPCPQASWNRIPPLPEASTRGSSPLGAGRAESLARARRAAVVATSSTSTVSNNSNPTVKADVSNPVCMPLSPVATHDTEKRERTWSSVTRTPSLLATWIRRRLSP